MSGVRFPPVPLMKDETSSKIELESLPIGAIVEQFGGTNQLNNIVINIWQKTDGGFVKIEQYMYGKWTPKDAGVSPLVLATNNWDFVFHGVREDW